MANRPDILVVDDNSDILAVVHRDLKRAGCNVRVALSGEQALAMVGCSRPDLIILDIVMGGIDGYQVCRRLRDLPRTRSVPILILSSRDSPASQVSGLELGADDYVTKPFILAELRMRVQALLRRCRPKPDPPSSRARPKALRTGREGP